MKIYEFKNKGVYIIQNIITKDFYIGSSTNIGNRLTKHMSLLRNNKHNNYLLQSAVNKFGIENFKIGVLEYVDENGDLKQREQFYSNKYSPAYNITKDCINNTPSESSKLKMSITKKRLFKEGKIKPNGCKPIVQKDLDGNILREYESISEAARQTGFHLSSIKSVLSKKHKQCKGNIFEYKLAL